MAAKPTKKRPRAIQAAQGKLGKAKRPAPAAVRQRATASDLLETDQLETRQAMIGKTRRTGGPALDAKPKGKTAVPKTPQTEPGVPVGKRKRAVKRRSD